MIDLIQITGLAIVDAINPCTLTIQAFLLSALLVTKGRKSALLGGIFFTSTIYVMYFLYGIGILQVIYVLGLKDVLFYILVAMLLIMSFLQFMAYFSYKPGFRALEIPLKFRPFVKNLLSRVNSPLSTIPVAALCSIVLLPCTSGPYLSALIILAASALEKFLILAYYNFIFVLPMIGVTLFIAFGTNPEKILKWKDRYKKEFHLLAGVLLLIVLIALFVGV